MIKPKPNPNAEQARADMRDYNAQYKSVDEPQGETVIAEWHHETDRTFSVSEVRRWFKVARPLSEAARRL